MNTKRVIALGFFDGVHLGHGALLSLCAQRAAELGAVPAAFTFDAHPASFITGVPTPLLSTPADRADIMERCYGIREVIVAHYDQGMMKMPWQSFVTDFLIRDHAAVHVVAGHDFHFGYKGEGNPQRLQELCGRLGVGCDIVPKVELDGITVSSTHIRNLIAQGEMDEAVRFLGHPQVYTGTAAPDGSVALPAGLQAPRPGTYAGQAVLSDGRTYAACLQVLGDGVLPAFEAPVPPLTGQSVRLEFSAVRRVFDV